MSVTNISKGLPSSKLIETLVKKINEECQNIEFNFLSHLSNLRDQVNQEISYINSLFPEYTPHDEKYHIHNLFIIADQILGDSVINNMNAIELFLLIASLYAHDWGMAVSESERSIICELAIKNTASTHSFSLIEHEKEKFCSYLKDSDRIDCLNDANPTIPVDLWRNYIRNTHSERSGERIYSFFKNYNLGIAEAAKKICVGHGLNFEDLRNKRHYSTNLSVLSHIVNMRAITIYVRLIDLLDLTGDRTPYIIWKYVSPQNQYSKMEWNKHRALYSIACHPYNGGRTIKIDGSTDDHEVYAALNDLMDWCNSQFKSCNDLLAEMNSPNHKLDLYHIDWNISTKGFSPINIRFEFNRSRMFQILGEEIYSDDPYVFLRELLQNSIDAIATRAEWLKQKNIPIDIGSFGFIKVNVVSDEKQIVINWQDNGIGMNEYIIKNYLSVAGNSYYSSNDFKSTGINIDPISKFGIGLLSCSTVSDYIEILTYRDPYLEPNSTALLVKIPSFDRYFRVENLVEQEHEVGTTVTVYIDKTSDKTKKFDLSEYDVTNYLSYVAGFVKIPILINENGKITSIIHPYSNPEIAISKLGREICVNQTNLSYKLDDLFISKSISNLPEIFEEKIYYIDRDMNLTRLEGVVSYPCVINDNHDVLVSKNSLVITDIAKTTSYELLINSDKYSRYPDDDYIINICPSCKVKHGLVLYKDGILVSDVSRLYSFFSSFESSYFTPKVLINICTDDSVSINVSRNDLTNKNDIVQNVYNAFTNYIINKHYDHILSLDNFSKLKFIERLIKYNYIDLNFVPDELIVIPVLKCNGEVDILNWNNLKNNTLYTAPSNMEDYCINATNATVFDFDFDFFLETYWKCDVDSIILIPSRYTLNSNSLYASIKGLLDASHYQAGVRFLSAPTEDKLPLIQYKWKLREDPLISSDNSDDFINRMLDKDYCITSEDFKDVTFFLNTFNRKMKIDFWSLPKITEFIPPYDKYFGFGINLINLNHHLVQALIKSLIRICYDLSTSTKSNSDNYKNVGSINTILRKLRDISYDYCSFEDFRKYWIELWANISNDYLVYLGYSSNMSPAFEEFIKDSISIGNQNEEPNSYPDAYEAFEYDVNYLYKSNCTFIEFGMPKKIL